MGWCLRLYLAGYLGETSFFLVFGWSLCLWHDRQGEKIPRKENPLSWDAADEDTAVAAVAGGMELNTSISQMMGSLVM